MRQAFFILLLIGCFISKAQEDYLVTLKNDTIYGRIGFLKSTYYDEVEVRTDNGREIFKAFQVKSAFSDGGTYLPITYQNKKVIGKLISDGRLSLYYVRPEDQNQFSAEVLIKGDGQNLLVSNIGFRKRLASFLDDCEMLSEKIAEKEIELSDLDKIMNIYNNDCEETIKEPEVEKVDFSELKELSGLIKDITIKLESNEPIPSYMIDALEKYEETDLNQKLKDLLQSVKNQ